MTANKFVAIFVVALLFSGQCLGGYNIRSLECSTDPTICQNPVCNFTTTVKQPKVFHINVGCVLTKPITAAMLRIRSYVRKNNNYEPIKDFTFLDINICSFSKFSSTSMLFSFLPTLLEQFKKLFDKCPYESKFAAEDFIVDGSGFPNIFGRKYIKNEIVFTRGKYAPMLTVVIYGNFTAN